MERFIALAVFLMMVGGAVAAFFHVSRVKEDLRLKECWTVEFEDQTWRTCQKGRTRAGLFCFNPVDTPTKTVCVHTSRVILREE
jgi:hypothetical protein